PLTAPRPTDAAPLALHDALPICVRPHGHHPAVGPDENGTALDRAALDGNDPPGRQPARRHPNAAASREVPRPPSHPKVGCPVPQDRKSTRLNSSHEWISYAVFCL